MSKTVDDRVLEMRFDNEQFEKGVATSMSTLDKLKEKLNFKGAEKGMEQINAAAKSVNFNGLSAGIDTVKAKFSAMQVIGVTALANITNSVMATGKRMSSMVTTDPIRDGFREYETQINAVQTILANTQKEGTNVKIVNKALDELNTYADKTIYNFTEMTRNIGTFTAAGVKLDTSVNAIQGIANLAAVSGSTSQQASVAMYQLSQALAAGTIKLMDWNSVVNAGMGGQLFQNALTETSEKLKTGAKAAIETEGSFRESLSKGWLTAEVLTETLKKFTTSGATEYVAEYTGLSKEAVEATLEETDAWGKDADAIDKAATALSKKSGKSKEEIASALQFAKTAEDAATKVKTFTQLIDTLKEALGSGWTTSWRLIIGDFEEAKELWTNVSDFLGGIINKSADTRNKIIEGALYTPFAEIKNRIESVTGATKAMTEATKDFDSIVTQVIRGNFGNGQKRYEALTKAGYDWAYIQNKVNERLGDSTRHATNFKEATEEVNQAQAVTIEQLLKMSDAELKQTGFTETEIKGLRDLAKQSKKTGISIEELMKDTSKLSGRNLMIDSFKNAAKGLVTVCNSIQSAWKQAFWGDATEEDIIATKTQILYDAIAAIHKFSTYLVVNEESANNLRRTFAGLFSIIDLFVTLANGGLKFAFQVLKEVLSLFNLDILDVTAKIGDLLVKFHDVILENATITGSAKAVAGVIKYVITEAQKLYNIVSKIPEVQAAIEKITDAFERLGKIDVADAISKGMGNLAAQLSGYDFFNIGENITAGLQNGISSGAGNVISAILNIASSIISAICDALEIHSPSRKMIAIGVFIVAGLCIGLAQGTGQLNETINTIGNKLLEWGNNLDWNKIFAVGSAVGIIAVTKQLADAVTNFSKAFAGFGNLMNSIAGVVKGFNLALDGVKSKYKSEALKNLAVSIAILTACVVAIAKIPLPDLGKALVIVTLLTALLVGLSFAISKMSDASMSIGKDGAKLEGLKTGLIQIGVTLIALALIIKLIGSMDTNEATQGFIGLTVLMGELLIFLGIMGKIGKSDGFKNTDGMTSMMLKLTIALGLMALVVKLISTLSPEEMLQGAAFATAFLAFSVILGLAARIAGPNATEFGKMMKKMAVSMALMVAVCKLVGLLSIIDMIKGAAFATAFVVFARLLSVAARIAGNGTNKLSSTLLSIAFSMGLMVGVCKLAGMLSKEEMEKGATFATAFIVFVGLLNKVTQISNDKKTAKLLTTILGMTIAIAAMAAISVALSLVSVEDLAKGIVAVGLLGAILAGMIHATKGANEVKGSIIAMAVAIGIMAASVVALSFIKPENLFNATAALGILMGMFAYMEKSAPLVKGSMSTIISMVVVVGLLTGVLVLLSALNVNNAIQNAAGLGILMVSLGASMKLMNGVGDSVNKAIPAIFALSLAAGILGIIVMAMSALHVENAIQNSAAVSLMIISLGATMRLISGIGEISSSVMITIGILTGVMVAIGAVLLAMSYLKVDNAIQNAAAISLVMVSLSAALVMISVASALAVPAAAGLAPLLTVMGVMSAVMVAIAGLVTLIPGLETFLKKALPILKLIGQGIGEFLGGIITGVGNAVIDLIPKFGMALNMFALQMMPFCTIMSSIDSDVVTGTKNLSLAILELTGTNLIAGIGQIITKGSNFATLGKQLTVFGAGVLPFLATLKTVKPEDIESGKTLADLVLTLSKADFLSRITRLLKLGNTDFEQFGTMLSAFGDAMVDFSDKVKGKIDNESMEAAAKAGEAMTKLSEAIPKTGGWVQKILGESDLKKFAEACEAFGTAIHNMSDTLTGKDGTVNINEAAIDSLCKAGKALSKLNKSLPEQNGWVQSIVGSKDLSIFGDSCKAFGECIKELSGTLTGDDGSITVNVEYVKSLAKAGKALSDLNKSLPKQDGWVQNVVGSQDLEAFGESCEAFCDCIRTISSSLTSEGGELLINESAIQSVVTSANMLLELQNALEDTGGVLKIFSSKKDLGDFANKISIFADGMADFATKVTGIDTSAMSSITTSAKELINISEMINGTNFDNVTNFSRVGEIGTAMNSYYAEVANVSPAIVTSTVNSAMKLRDLIVKLSGLDTSGITNFKVNDIALAIKNYALNVSGIDAGEVETSISAVRNLINLINGMSGMDTSGVSSFKTAVDQLSGVDLSGVAKSFSSSASSFVGVGSKFVDNIGKGMKTKQSQVIATGTSITTALANTMKSRSSQFHAIGVMLMTKFVSGMRSQNSNITSSATGALNNAAARLRSYYNTFRGAGGYVASGFAAGIRSGIQAAANASAQMAAAAVSAARKNLKVASPSKVFKKIGEYVPQGFAIGISHYGSMVKKSVSAMTNAAVNTSQKAMTRVLQAVDGSVDSQPSIRPVVDLSDVKTGVRALNGMLNTADTSIGIRANLSGIAYSMNTKNQNGFNSEVVSAIDKLRQDLSGIDKPTYVINGVTYDDGSNIANAVADIVKAARIGGRA